eukprot:3560615-Alexandrium_andersonii.AAC.1
MLHLLENGLEQATACLPGYDEWFAQSKVVSRFLHNPEDNEQLRFWCFNAGPAVQHAPAIKKVKVAVYEKRFGALMSFLDSFIP